MKPPPFTVVLFVIFAALMILGLIFNAPGCINGGL